MDERSRGREVVEVRFLGPLTVNVYVTPPGPSGPGPATKARLTLGGHMPGQITVDTTDETVTVGFVDDKGDATDAPTGTQVSFTSSDTAVATIVPDASNPLQGDVVPVAPGTTELSASFGGTALEADGQTPIPDPDPVAVQVDPGAAAGARLTLAV